MMTYFHRALHCYKMAANTLINHVNRLVTNVQLSYRIYYGNIMAKTKKTKRKLLHEKGMHPRYKLVNPQSAPSGTGRRRTYDIPIEEAVPLAPAPKIRVPKRGPGRYPLFNRKQSYRERRNRKYAREFYGIELLPGEDLKDAKLRTGRSTPLKPFPPKTSRRNRESSKGKNPKPKRKCPTPKPQVQRRTSARVAKKTQILEQGKFIFILYHVLSL